MNTYKKNPSDPYAMYLNKGCWMISASVRNEDLDDTTRFSNSADDIYIKIEAPSAVAPVHDPVNNPKHYYMFNDGTQAIDLIKCSLTPEEFKGYLKGNFLKYRLRAGDKGATQQDIDKSNWYKATLNEFIK